MIVGLQSLPCISARISRGLHAIGAPAQQSNSGTVTDDVAVPILDLHRWQNSRGLMPSGPPLLNTSLWWYCKGNCLAPILALHLCQNLRGPACHRGPCSARAYGGTVSDDVAVPILDLHLCQNSRASYAIAGTVKWEMFTRRRHFHRICCIKKPQRGNVPLKRPLNRTGSPKRHLNRICSFKKAFKQDMFP